MLGMISGGSGPAPLVELDIQGDTRAALARVGACAQAYWKAWAQTAAGTDWGQPHWELYLRQSGANPAAMPERLDWETRAPSRPDAPLYSIWLRPDTPLPPDPSRLRVIPYTDYYKQTQLRLVINRNKTELMCEAYFNEDGNWIVNPMFIEPKSQHEPYACSTEGMVLPDGEDGPLLDDKGQAVPDQTDSVFAG